MEKNFRVFFSIFLLGGIMDNKEERKGKPLDNNETIDQKVERLLNKDFSKEIVNPIIKNYSTIIKYLIGKKIGFSNPDLEDLDQEVWLKVFNYIKMKSKGFIIDCEQKEYLKRLIAKTAHDVVYDYLVKKRKLPRTYKKKENIDAKKVYVDNEYEKDYAEILGGEVSIEILPENLLSVTPNHKCVLDSIMRKIFNTLSIKDQKIIYTFLWVGKSYEQAHKELGFKTQGACKTYLYRVKQKFYKRLEEYTKKLSSSEYKELLGETIYDKVSNIHRRTQDCLRSKS
jgi:DNA-directed RNA polymerase specialized sigma24 family protein